ncbi:folate-binding protein YgfZ [Halopseudomonas nanhaiensis]|uniref:CAF17-like 4Fe-4S cluster assembly/insertion protein YgfZ n=1 Tax=Halopseudomonas nanhaiensis TaxID=2830842 RepID=UPI001CBC4EBD|nr:folate-binding protein [Halopseudomonas nanhaiensis]UAW97724.1 folate-binding protein YgfZ [Halopseudomonas nanhaiensis]
MPQTSVSSSLAATFTAPLPAQGVDTALCLLDHEAVIALTGPDTARFLQGQVTCDVNTLQAGQSTLGARCNPKGRMQSSFRLTRLAEDSFLLVLHAELLERQIAELKKYAVFFKTQLQDVTAEWLRLGIHGSRLERVLGESDLPCPASRNSVAQSEQSLVIRIADDAAEIWLRPDQASSTIEHLTSTTTALASQAWTLWLIRAGIGQVYPETYETFIPQMLNLQQLGGVSFRKGCYTGQEIVARMQYLGKLKRRMYRTLLAGDTAPPPGTVVVDRATGQTVGEIVMAARSESGVESLAVLQKDAAQLTTLVVGNSDGPLLSLGGLPYDAQLEAGEADKE